MLELAIVSACSFYIRIYTSYVLLVFLLPKVLLFEFASRGMRQPILYVSYIQNHTSSISLIVGKN